MVGSNKILTVSYGTFSCTLEGFDEPFTTMKAIAEYFRDLAADDRYFGAEPPTPDAEMLSRIAEREIQRRVEARLSDQGIVLRQTDGAPVAPAVLPAAAAPAPEPAPAAEPAPESAATAAGPAPAEGEAPESEAPETLAEAEEAEEFAEEAFEEQTVETPADDDAEDWGAPLAAMDEVEEEVAAFAPGPEAEPELLADAEAMDESEADELSIETLMAEAAAEPAAEEPAPMVAAYEPAAEEIEPDSVAAKLMRIRAVVEGVRAGTIQPYADEEEAEADEIAAAPADADFAFDLDQAEDAPELLAAEAARAAERAAAEEPETEAGVEAAAIEVGEEIEALAEATAGDAGEEIDDEEELTARTAETASAEDEDVEAGDVEALLAEAEAAEAPDAEETLAEADEAYEDEDYGAESEAEAAMEPVETAEEMEEAADGSAAMPSEDAELLARISELRAPAEEEPCAQEEELRASEEAAVADHSPEDLIAHALAEAEPEQAAEPPAEPERQPGFFQRARARVIRLARAATILGHSDTEERPAERAEDEAEPEADKPEPFLLESPLNGDTVTPDDDAARAEDDDPDLSRLMEEAKSKLEGAETRRRFSAISHLKAAVAATLADRQLSPAEPPAEPPVVDETEIELYRDDLSKAVRPRRPTADGASTPRPSIDLRPAPLVLVSEQRIDRPDASAPRDAGLIRPRRVAKGSLAVFAEPDEPDDLADETEITPESASSFKEFADRLGATTLTELLEAAAVYTASVEGMPHFTRPHLLRKVEFVSSRGNFNREDGLRSFGTLLREGKIQKISRGQFMVSGSSRFMSEARQVH